MKRVISFIIAILFISISYGQLTPFQSKKAWGFTDSDGKIVVQPTYTAVGYFNSGYTWVNSGGKINKGSFPEGGKWGVIDSTGTLVCPVQYEFVDLCSSDGIIAVNVGGQMKDTIIYGGKWGFYTLPEKKELISPRYTAISQTYNGKGIWVSESNVKCSYQIRTNKDIVNQSSIEISPVFNVNDNDAVAERCVSKQPLSWEYVDYNGNLLCSESFGNVSALQNGLFTVKKNGKLGRIDLQGKIIMPCEYTWMGKNGDGNVFWAQIGDTKFLFSEDGKKISEKGYRNVTIFYDSVAFASEKGDKYCLINNHGEELTPFIFTKFWEFCNGYSSVVVENKYVIVIDAKGNKLLDTNFKSAPSGFGKTGFNDNGKPYSYGVRMDDTVVWFDIDGKILQDSTKTKFGINDKIPEGLWNY